MGKHSLEDLALRPILDPTELGSTADDVLSLARSSHRSRFRAAFDAEPSLKLIAKALASYLRTIVDGDSACDRFALGRESGLTASARRGLTLFNSKAGCGQCHSGPSLTDEQFHNTGIAWRTGVLADQGRAGVTGAAADRGAFRTPTLRSRIPTSTVVTCTAAAGSASIALFIAASQSTSSAAARVR